VFRFCSRTPRVHVLQVETSRLDSRQHLNPVGLLQGKLCSSPSRERLLCICGTVSHHRRFISWISLPDRYPCPLSRLRQRLSACGQQILDDRSQKNSCSAARKFSPCFLLTNGSADSRCAGYVDRFCASCLCKTLFAAMPRIAASEPERRTRFQVRIYNFGYNCGYFYVNFRKFNGFLGFLNFALFLIPVTGSFFVACK
jgi:hypothetical protein